MMTVHSLYCYLSEKLALVSDEPETEARLILQHILSLSYTGFLLNKCKEISETEKESAVAVLSERIRRRPLQYILGKWDFFGQSFFVGEGVLVPRPETEQLCEYVIEKLKKMSKPIVYDLCAGSGCIGLTLKMQVPDAQVYLFEKSPEAMLYLEKNRRNLGLARQTVTVQGDVLKGYDAFSCLPVPDVIVSNPPYIASFELSSLQPEVKNEPQMALDGGTDGLLFYKAIAEKWLSKMKNGFAAVECGENQAAQIVSIFSDYAKEIEIIKDFNQIDRIVAAQI